MPPIRLGVIGAGLIWRRVHQPILSSMPEHFAPVAFCDVDPGRRAALAEEYPQALVCAEATELLALPEVDTVLVLTPIALNAPTALAALRAGKDVLMEKPIARSVAEGEALLAAARQQGRRLLVLEQMAYRQAELIVAQLIAAGEIGRLLLWERVFHLEPDPETGSLRYDSTRWRKEADYPLGTLFDGGIHQIAALNRVFGRPQAVVATGRRLRPDYGEYDHVHMVLRYADGSVGTISHSTCLPQVGNHFHIYGSEAMLVVEPTQVIVQHSHRPRRVVALPEERAYTAMWDTLAAALASGCEPEYTAERAVADVAVLEAVDRSIKANAWIAIG